MAQARAHAALPEPRASVLQLFHVFWLPEAPALLLHPFILRPFRIPATLSWATIRDTGSRVHRIIPATSFLLLEKGVNPFPSSLADTSSLQKKVFLTNNYTLIFILLLSLLTCAPRPWGESLPDFPLSPFVTFVSPQHNEDPDGEAEEGHARSLERNHSASVWSENEDSE